MLLYKLHALGMLISINNFYLVDDGQVYCMLDPHLVFNIVPFMTPIIFGFEII